MKYYIGIDGGGTKTNCILCNQDLEVLFRTQSGPSNFLTIGTEIVAQTILNLVKKTSAESNVKIKDIKAVVLGTTGAGRESDAVKLESMVKQLSETENIKLNQFQVLSDARIALEGAFTGKPGSILIAGTGSIMFGKDAEGNIHRVGGFGRLIGDEGSGLTLGKKGLNLYAKFLDDRGKDSILFKMINEKYNVNDISSLITEVYSNNMQIQDVAPMVIKAAAEKDEQCLAILEEEANELLLHIAAMSKKLQDPEMKLVFIGGTLTNDNEYSKMLVKKMSIYMPKIIVQEADYPPEIGAVLIAKKID